MTDRWRIAWLHSGGHGGSKRAALEMVRQLTGRGHQVDEYLIRLGTASREHWPLSQYVGATRELVHRLPSTTIRPYLLGAWLGYFQRWLAERRFLAEVASLATTIDGRGYDLIHVDACSPSDALLVVPWLRTPAIAFYHGVTGAGTEAEAARGWPTSYADWCRIPRDLWIRRRWRRDDRALGRCTAILTNSRFSNELLATRLGLPGTVCHYGVDLAAFAPGPVPVEPMVFSPGRIVAAKQHHLVVDALASIAPSARPRLVIATPESRHQPEDPGYGTALTRRAAQKSVELDIIWQPAESGLVDLYRRAAALAFVPVREPFGLVAIEAMACGTPVVGVREGGLLDSVIDGETGWLVDRDPSAIGAAIERLLADPERRAAMGRAARRHVEEHWSWDRHTDHYEAVAASVIDRTSSTRATAAPPRDAPARADQPIGALPRAR